MEYAGNVTQESNEQNNAITTCIYGWWKSSMVIRFLRKANFSLLQRNIFYLTTKLVENIEKLPPTQSQLSNIIKPNKINLK